MAKKQRTTQRSQSLKIRLSERDLIALKEAALSQGESLSQYVLSAARQRAKTKTITKNQAQTALRAALEEAQKGGTFGYFRVGIQASIGMRNLLRHEGRGAPNKKMTDLYRILGRGSDKRLLDWFEKNLASVLHKIPQRRRHSFIAGVRQAVEEDLLV